MGIHDFAWSRSRVDPALMTDAERAAHPPVRQAVVVNGPYGEALYLGAHATGIEGMADAEARPLIDRLIAFGTQERFVYRHAWTPHDLVLWDNRAVLHRATPFHSGNERRHMVRTTVAGEGPTILPRRRGRPPGGGGRLRWARPLLGSAVLAPCRGAETTPGEARQSDAELLAYARERGSTGAAESGAGLTCLRRA